MPKFSGAASVLQPRHAGEMCIAPDLLRSRTTRMACRLLTDTVMIQDAADSSSTNIVPGWAEDLTPWLELSSLKLSPVHVADLVGTPALHLASTQFRWPDRRTQH